MTTMDDVLRFAPWSPSMADLALDCPYAFHHRYVLKEKVVEVESVESTVGTVVHRVLEWTLQGAKIDVAFKKAFETYAMPYETQLQVQTFRTAVQDFVTGMARYRTQFQVSREHTEYKAALTPEFKLTTFFDPKGLVRGVIDLILFTRRHQAVIIDHKTGSIKPTDKYTSQARVYSLFADAMEPGLQGMRMAIHYVAADPNAKGTRTVWLPEYPIEMVRTTLRQELLDYLTRAATSAMTQEARPCWRCKYCGYQAGCPAKKEQAA